MIYITALVSESKILIDKSKELECVLVKLLKSKANKQYHDKGNLSITFKCNSL